EYLNTNSVLVSSGTQTRTSQYTGLYTCIVHLTAHDRKRIPKYQQCTSVKWDTNTN
ncbi:hypothetical protein J6590_017559, partial [Homalodisca vitripennis]